MKMTKADVRDGKMHVWGKSRASNRWLTMTKEVSGILIPRLELNSEWLFPSDSPLNRNGHIVTLQRAQDDVFTALLSKDPEYGRFTIYDFRHTFATRAAIGNPPMPIPVLAAILGHGSLSSVYKYVHPNQGHMDEAMMRKYQSEL
jgi:integrase